MKVYLTPPQPSRGLEHCEWKRVIGIPSSGMYFSSCGEVNLLEGTPEDAQPCPYCDKPITVTVKDYN